MKSVEFNTLLLAGILKGFYDPLAKEQFSTVEELDGTLLEDLILGKGTSALHLILEHAQNYSGVKHSGAKEEVMPLASVFSALDIGKPKDAPRYHDFKPWQLEAVFPVEKAEVNTEGYRRLKQGFLEDLRLLLNKGHRSFKAFYTRTLLLLQKYAWCVPGDAPGEKVDVSLFDQSKATAAIGACLFKYHANLGDWSPAAIANKNAHKFRLLVGDISGIQNYIFDISKTGVGGVAKRLRARSFYLNMISEVISHKILHELDLPLSNIVMASGGNFYILLQNTPDVIESLETLQRDLDEWCLKEFRGELAVNLASVDFSGEDFQNFHEVLGKLSLKLSQKKSMPLYHGIVYDQKWQEEAFRNPWEDMKGLGLCRGCGKQLATAIVEDTPLCRYCEDDLDLGGRLPKASYIVFTKGAKPQKGLYPLFEDYSFGVFGDMPKSLDGVYLVTKINDLGALEEGEYPLAFKYVANFVPTSSKGKGHGRDIPLDFDQIASFSSGRPWLGYYKADVDHLGSLFAFGLVGGENPITISRIATLSRMMDTFFSGWVVETVHRRYPHSYIVFSGGDDLLIIGPWDNTLDMALEFRREFERFTAHNPNITLSAGIHFSKPKIPVSVAVERAEQFLDCSKEKLPLTGEGEGRDQLTAFGETLKWEKVPFVLENAKLLARWLKGNKLSVNFVRNLKAYHEMFKAYLVHQRSEGLKYLPLLSYDIARNLAPLNHRDKEKRSLRRWAEELKDINGDKMRYLGFIADYALNAREVKR